MWEQREEIKEKYPSNFNIKTFEDEIFILTCMMYERKNKRSKTLCHIAKAEKWRVGLHFKKGWSPTSFYHPK